MKRILLLSSLLLSFCLPVVFSQPENDTSVYLLTCGPGTETYSIYGHSALRVVISANHSDNVYNWGVFDFNTSHFVWKFAKGRLDYMLDTESLKSFLQEYFSEQRYVYSQKVNLNAVETKILLSLIRENLKPENKSYRYDFFYDDCSTRIRDLFEKSVGSILLYPPAETGRVPTFREMVGKYQQPYPWYKFGVDLIMGSTADRKASFRDRMFLPIDMKDELSQAVINRSGKMISLLQNPVTVLDFNAPVIRQNFFTSPSFVFTLIMIIVIILSSLVKGKTTNKIMDLAIFSVFSTLAVLMVFFNFFSDHQQMKWNLNILWINPFILICLVMIIINRKGTVWFRIVFYFSALFAVLQFILPQTFNIAIIPLDLIILFRSSIRADFNWNPIIIDS
jgi:hypothetical protein